MKFLWFISLFFLFLGGYGLFLQSMVIYQTHFNKNVISFGTPEVVSCSTEGRNLRIFRYSVKLPGKSELLSVGSFCPCGLTEPEVIRVDGGFFTRCGAVELAMHAIISVVFLTLFGFSAFMILNMLGWIEVEAPGSRRFNYLFGGGKS